MEQPIIQFQQEEGGILKFTISSIDVSFVNALRRTILSDIPIIVFKTTPYEQNKCNIISNTTRLNNEIIITAKTGKEGRRRWSRPHHSRQRG